MNTADAISDACGPGRAGGDALAMHQLTCGGHRGKQLIQTPNIETPNGHNANEEHYMSLSFNAFATPDVTSWSAVTLSSFALCAAPTDASPS